PHPKESVPGTIDSVSDSDQQVATYWSQEAFDLSHVKESVYLGPASVATSRQMVWMRARGTVPEGPGSELLHRCLLAYACDQVMLEPLLRRHGRAWTTPGLSIARLAHAMWFHRPDRKSVVDGERGRRGR